MPTRTRLQCELVTCCNVKGAEKNDDRAASNMSSVSAPSQLEAPSGVYKMPVTPTNNI